jgi:succinate dehydrogenase / fumarate reductase, iron-sulfur subunit
MKPAIMRCSSGLVVAYLSYVLPVICVPRPRRPSLAARSLALPRSHRRHAVGVINNLTLKIWRQDSVDAAGSFETHHIDEISEEASLLELLDVLNERLIAEGKDAIVFDHDCREGICGTCSLMIDGQAHGPQRGTATCQLHMRTFADGAEIVIEPWRARSFPVIKDLMVDRSAFDRIVEVGGFISAPTGGAPDANLILIPKPVVDAAMDAAECISCGACVAACPNGAANLFTGAKIAHLNLLPQGQSERLARTEAMVETMEQYFGSCTNYGECEAACPKSISIDVIALMNADYLKAKVKNRKKLARI